MACKAGAGPATPDESRSEADMTSLTAREKDKSAKVTVNVKRRTERRGKTK